MEITQHRAAKVIGLMFLFGMANSLFVEIYLRGSLFVPGNFAASAENIMSNPIQFRTSVALDFLTNISVLLLAWSFYILVKPINRALALLGVLLRSVEVSFFCLVLVSRLAVVLLLSNDDFLKVFEPAQLQALSRVTVKLWNEAYTVGFALLGLGSTVFNYLLYRSDYVPKLLAGLGVFSSSLVFISAFIIIIFPALGNVPFWLGPIFIYEIALGLWFVFKAPRLTTT